MALYEARRPALISITVNKEALVNEATGTIGLGVTLYRARSGLIDPADYEQFDAFLEAVQLTWNDCWHRAYALRAKGEGGGLAGQLKTAVRKPDGNGTSLW